MLYISKYTYDIILGTFANSVGKYECKWFKVIDAFGFHSVSTLEARYIYIYIYIGATRIDTRIIHSVNLSNC